MPDPIEHKDGNSTWKFSYTFRSTREAKKEGKYFIIPDDNDYNLLSNLAYANAGVWVNVTDTEGKISFNGMAVEVDFVNRWTKFEIHPHDLN